MSDGPAAAGPSPAGPAAADAVPASAVPANARGCEHEPAGAVEPRSDGCAECLRAGGIWFHLRLCLTCGHVGCCDRSPGQHATAHFRAAGHPVIRSFEAGEAWRWCYLDEEAFGLDDEGVAGSA